MVNYFGLNMDLLEKAVALENEASEFGFQWETTDQIMAQIQSKCIKINEHLNKGIEQANQAELQEEIGDLLHAVFSFRHVYPNKEGCVAKLLITLKNCYASSSKPLNVLVSNPFHEGYLKVSSIHELRYAEYGNPKGVPVIVLHGGPGAGSSPHDATFFDLKYWRVILLDQRGAGRSQPFTEIRENTTQDLINDIECLRNHLHIDQWVLFGGSWGSALALAYGETYPTKVKGFILRGLFLGREAETQQIWRGMRDIFPDAWQEMVDFLPKEEQADLEASFYKRILNPDRHIALPAARALMKYDLTCAFLTASSKTLDDMLNNETLILGVARTFSHYAKNHYFLQPDQLMRHLEKINHLPLILVNGRYDVIAIPKTAFLLHSKWPGSKLHIVEAAGHSAMEPKITSELINATEEMKNLLKGN